MDFNIDRFAFLYGDYQYFQWFKNKTKPNLREALRWKGLNRVGNDKIEKILKRVWDSKNKKIITNNLQFLERGPVTCAFLHHLEEPTKYPILDKNVFTGMRELNPEYERKTNTNISNWETDYIKGYKAFFENFYRQHKKEIHSIKIPFLDGIEREIIRRKILDRALWEYGKMLLGKQESKNC